MLISDAIVAINQQHGLSLRPGKRYLRGEQGAYAVVDATGIRYVLKWNSPDAHERIRRARRVTEHLRDSGYPAPSYLLDGVVDGVSYSVQELLPGRPMLPFDPMYLPQLLALNDLQRGPAPIPTGDWPREIVDSVLVGATGYCVLASLDGYSAETRELLDRAQTLVTSDADIACPADDVVHFDFNPANILVENGRISGVVDWDGVTVGDRMFDLVTALFYMRSDRDARQTLWRYLGIHSTHGAVSLYLAHMIIRQVDWSIRHHDAETITLWVENADNLLNELAATGSPNMGWWLTSSKQ